MLSININVIGNSQTICDGPFEVDLSSGGEHTIDDVLYQLGISTLDELCNFGQQYSMVIGGTLLLDKPGEEICFDGINIKMLDYATIRVRPNTTLSLNSVHIFGCGTMWRGISVDNAIINVTGYSLIEDASQAIWAGDNSIVNLRGATFNNNSTAILVGLPDKINSDNIFVSGCTFSTDTNFEGESSYGITIYNEGYAYLSGNVFDNLKNGVFGWYSAVRVEDCEFKNIGNSNSWSNSGVKLLNALEYSNVSNNIFENSYRGISSSGSPIVAKGNFMNNVNIGISVRWTNVYGIELSGNKIIATDIAIDINSCNRYAPNVAFEAYNNDLEIAGNNSAAKAISVQSSDYFSVIDNDITMHSNEAGIFVRKSNDVSIKENTISVQGLNGISTDAIHLEDSKSVEVVDNYMKDYGPGCDGENIGIFSYTSFGDFACNETHDFKRGINFFDDCDNSYLDGNRFYNNARDLVLGNAVVSSTTVIGKQGDFPNLIGWGNKWFSDNGGTAYNYSPADYVSWSQFLVNSNQGAWFKPQIIYPETNDWFWNNSNATNKSSCSGIVVDPYPDTIRCEDLITKILTIDTSRVFDDCKKAIWKYHYFKKLLLLKKKGQLIDDCLGFFDNNGDNVLVQIAKVDSAIANILIQESADTQLYSDIVNTQSELDDMYDQGNVNTDEWNMKMNYLTQLISESDTLIAAEKVSDDQKIDSVKNVITTITVSDSCLKVLINMYNIELDYIKSDSLTPEQYEYTDEVAQYCPSEFGDGVFVARSIMSRYENVRYASIEECSSAPLTPRSEIQFGGFLNVYPNPAIDELNISIDIPKGEFGEISIVNLQGKVIRVFRANNTKNSFKVSTEDYKSGVYFIKYISNTGTQTTEKLIISK